jgi:peptide deformylase
MARLRVLTVGDPVLKERAREVDCSREDLTALVENMGETMYSAPGIGLAATQCGIIKRLLVYDVDEGLNALVNPQVVWRCEETEEDEEGCLSVPDVKILIERPAKVRVTGQDVTGAPVEIAAEGLLARVLQHEIDHLDGILILDRASREERKRAIRQQKEAERAQMGHVIDEHAL